MSRIGRMPITVPAGVEVKISGQEVAVKGPKGSCHALLLSQFTFHKAKVFLLLFVQDDERLSRSLHGLSRTLVANMIEGVTNGYTKTIEIVGVGYRVAEKGKDLEFALGYSHPVPFPCTRWNLFQNRISNQVLHHGY